MKLKNRNWFKTKTDGLDKKNTPIFVLGHDRIIEMPDEEEKHFNLPIKKRNEIL